jgi:hypothetical protein
MRVGAPAVAYLFAILPLWCSLKAVGAEFDFATAGHHYERGQKPTEESLTGDWVLKGTFPVEEGLLDITSAFVEGGIANSDGSLRELRFLRGPYELPDDLLRGREFFMADYLNWSKKDTRIVWDSIVNFDDESSGQFQKLLYVRDGKFGGKQKGLALVPKKSRIAVFSKLRFSCRHFRESSSGLICRTNLAFKPQYDSDVEFTQQERDSLTRYDGQPVGYLIFGRKRVLQSNSGIEAYFCAYPNYSGKFALASYAEYDGIGIFDSGARLLKVSETGAVTYFNWSGDLAPIGNALFPPEFGKVEKETCTWISVKPSAGLKLVASQERIYFQSEEGKVEALDNKVAVSGPGLDKNPLNLESIFDVRSSRNEHSKGFGVLKPNF